MSQCSPSLAQHFEAPDDWIGRFGWICGYSADAHFLNEALERFTRQTQSQRAAAGQTAMALILEPGRTMISPVDVPGLVHLPLQSAQNRPFRLLHAKVALLGYRPVKNDGSWMLRLIVSTGNWTRQTLEESIDLFWTIDIRSTELDHAGRDEDLLMRRADLDTAWKMLKFLQGLFDMRLLERGAELADGGVKAAVDDLARWAKRGARRGKSRFIDNRKASFLAQLPDRVSAETGTAARNYLAMGSGFFEGASIVGERTVPVVLDRIVSALRKDDLLTLGAEVDIFVNPLACQAVAVPGALRSMLDRNWKVRKAATFGDRKLHGKFLFGANRRNNSPHCLNPWVYLGSGNLTGPGFTRAMSAHSGNLEAGVVFHPGKLTWDANGDGHGVQDRLPIRREEDFLLDQPLSEGAPPEALGEPFVAPPIAWLNWISNAIGQRLVSPSAQIDFAVLDPSGTPCLHDTGHFVWIGDQPRQVGIAWEEGGTQHRATVPVCDTFGRLAATPLPYVALDEVSQLLAGFPAPPDGEEDESDPTGGESRAVQSAQTQLDDGRSYSIRRMMDLVERIADQQCAIDEADWGAWCVRMEQTLSRVPTDSPDLAYFRELGLNPLTPLMHNPFRPDFAALGRPAENYEAMLRRIEQAWGMDDLAPLGEKA